MNAIAVAERQTAEIIQAPVTPMDLIQRASAQGASIEQMAQLFELKLRVEADEARKAFNVAMAAFKADPPQVTKNRKVSAEFKGGGGMDFHHATLDECVSKITPALARHGIRHRWDIDQSKLPQITVTCILSHELGHSESTPLTAGPDSTGSKNAIQAVGSAVTYLQRYTLLAATGLAAGGTDDDGSGAAPKMSDEEFIKWREAIQSASTLPLLQNVFGQAYKAAEAMKDHVTMGDLIKVKDECKKQLQGRG